VTKSLEEEIIIIVKETCEWVFSSKELSEDVLSSLECEELSLSSTTESSE